jgi:hypothetical protein
VGELATGSESTGIFAVAKWFVHDISARDSHPSRLVRATGSSPIFLLIFGGFKGQWRGFRIGQVVQMPSDMLKYDLAGGVIDRAGDTLCSALSEQLSKMISR